MFLDSFIAETRSRIARRREYNRLVNEIQALSARDLADIRGDRGEMLSRAYSKVYG